MRTLQSIIFDFDGVIADSVHIKTDAFVELYDQHSDQVKQSVKEYHIKNAGISRYKKIEYYETELLGNDLDKKRVEDIASKFSELVFQKVIMCDFVKGALEFLDKHHGNINFHIATGTPDEEIKLILIEKGISSYFKSVHGTPETKEEIVSSILIDFRYSTNSVVLVGDAEADYVGAKSNGIHFIGRVPTNEMSPFPIDTIIIDDLSQLEQSLVENFTF